MKYMSAAFVAALLAVFGVFGWQRHVQAEADRALEEQRAEQRRVDEERRERERELVKLRDWPFLPFKAAKLGDVPDRAPLGKYPTIEEGAKALLREHEGEAVRQLSAAIEKGEVVLSTKVLPGTLAYFAIERRKLTFSMTPNIVKQAQRSGSLRLEAETIVEHEAWHYLQWLAADETEKKTYLPMRRQDVDVPSQCRRFWRNEGGAYRKSCIYALQVGMPEFSNGTQQMCLRLDDAAAFDQYFFYSMIDSPTKDDMPECVPIWAELAGHPHPEAYR